VLLAAVVLPDGTVGEVTVLRSLDARLDAQAVVAAKQWLFNPA
jgi:TonB family protein